MKKIIIILIALISATVYSVAQVTFKASAPSTVVMNQQVRVSYTITGDAKEFRAPEFKGFEVLMGPSRSTSSSTSIVNGKVNSEYSITFTYILRPLEVGTFTISEATALVDGGRYTSNPLTIKVIKEDNSSSNAQPGRGNSGISESGSTNITSENLFIRMSLSKQTVYEQESLLATFKLYSRHDVSGIENIKFPEFEGFIAQEIDLPADKQWDIETYRDKNYRTIVLKQTLLFPQRSGDLKIPAGTFDAVVRISNPNTSRSIFDSFFDSYEDIKKTLTSNPATIKVLSLPSGKPESFSGAVGDFKLTSSISSDKVNANDAVTIKVEIAGNGNLRLIKNPEIKFPTDFEVYDPKVENNISVTANGVTGKRTIEYLIIPRFAGEFTVPSTTFSYFDPKSKSYKTLSIPEYNLHVEKGSGVQSGDQSVVNNFTNKESVRHLGQDIRFIKTNIFKLSKQNDFFYGSTGYWLCYIIPMLLFVIAFVTYRKQIKANADIALTKTRKANKVATKRLKLAQKYLKQKNKESYYEEISKALWGYLSDKLSIPLAYLTKDNVESELVGHNVAPELIKELLHILDTCEYARYAPTQVTETMDELYSQTADAIGKMENTIIKKK
ncbi:MAG: BatD family protein [Bacteroidales bacterium]